MRRPARLGCACTATVVPQRRRTPSRCRPGSNKSILWSRKQPFGSTAPTGGHALSESQTIRERRNTTCKHLEHDRRQLPNEVRNGCVLSKTLSRPGGFDRQTSSLSSHVWSHVLLLSSCLFQWLAPLDSADIFVSGWHCASPLLVFGRRAVILDEAW